MPHSSLLHLLVPTKLIPPQPLPAWVCRTELIRTLRRAARTPLTLVVAPAGFGKSTFVAQWLGLDLGNRACAALAEPPPAGQVAWLALDAHDQDAPRFLAYLVAAIGRVLPTALPTVRELLAARDLPPVYVLTQTLIAELGALAEPLTIVLDDYHTITADAIHQFTSYLLRHLPTHCHLVLISRSDPPIALARWRAEQHLTEVRVADLRFSVAETNRLLTNLHPQINDQRLALALQQQTDGWPLAIQLAALAQTDFQVHAQMVQSASRQITEYLAEEVLNQQPAPMQQILFALALPERFCSGLCAALLGDPEDVYRAESVIAQLLRANLFVLPLGDDGQWFRFHHLFRELLLRHMRLYLPADSVELLHRRAAAWFAQQEYLAEAIQHLRAVPDPDAAAALLESYLLPLTTQDVSSATLSNWLDLIPADLRDHRIGLVFIAARTAIFNMDLPVLRLRLAQLTDLLVQQPLPVAEAWQCAPNDYAAMQGILCFWEGRYAETIPLLEAALQQPLTPALAIQAVLVLGLAHAGVGAYQVALEMLARAHTLPSLQQVEHRAVCQYTGIAWMQQIAGDLGAQADAAQRLADLAQIHQAGELWIGYALNSQAMAAYARADLTTAAQYFQRVAERKYHVSHPGYMTSVIGLTAVALAQGDLLLAERWASAAQSFAQEIGGNFFQAQAAGCTIRVALAQGDLPRALHAVAQMPADVPVGLCLWFELPRLSQAQALITSGTSTHLYLAAAILDEYQQVADRLRHVPLQLHVWTLYALLEQARGDLATACAYLLRATQRAAPLGFRELFADYGPALLPLWRMLDPQPSVVSFPDPLLPPTPADPDPASQYAERMLGMPDMLTRREIEILGLLAQRLSDKEIAERLVITPNTVRKHTSTIYNKLGVSGRREAVHTAQSLGLLAPRLLPV